MLFTEKMIMGSVGTPLHLTVWEPDSPAVGVVQIVHGFGEYAGRYRDLARRFTDISYAVYCHDQQGHGKTPGKRGVAASYDALLEDVDVVRSRVGLEQPGLPVVLYGHSMGGNVALNHLLRSAVSDRYACAVVTGAWLRLARPYPEKVFRFLRGLARTMPRFTLHTAIGDELLAHDADYIAKTKSEGLCHNQIGVKLLTEVVDAGDYAIAHAAELPLPLLYLQGGEDRVVSPRGAEEFMKNAGPHAQLHVYPTQYHELHNDDLREEAFEEIVGFIRSQ